MPAKSDPLIRRHVYPTPLKVAEEVATRIASCAEQVIRERGEFHIVLAGGSTPRLLYGLLREQAVDVSRWQFYFGDERCVDKGDPGRNDQMALDAWLGNVDLRPNQLFAIPAELGPHDGARAYAETIKRVGPFDLVLLGLGEDGHTASLFPGCLIGNEPDAPATVAVTGAPTATPERVSLSARRLSLSRQAFFLVTGVQKREAVKNWFAGPAVPASYIRPASGVDLFLDHAAVPSRSEAT
jgi:6-phosphogluconolactonase